MAQEHDALAAPEQAAEDVARFVAAQNARTEAALMGADYAADMARVAAILEDPARIPPVTRRGRWLYTFRRTADHPRGLWLRRPEGGQVTAQDAWQTVFDLDAFCSQTGGDWHWRGAETAWFDPDRVLLALSTGGSDQVRRLEFDCAAGLPVPGGFDLPPARGYATWLDADTLLWSSAAPGDATDTSWPGTVRRLTRSGGMAAAEELFRARPEDLNAIGYTVPDAQGGRIPCVCRSRAIGQDEVTVFVPGGPVVLPAPDDTDIANSATHFAYVVRQSGGAPGALMLGEIGGPPAREIWRPGPRQRVDDASVLILQDWLIWTQEDNLRQSLWALDLRMPKAAPAQIIPPVDAEELGIGLLDAVRGADAGRAASPLVLYATGALRPPEAYVFDLEAGVDGITYTKLLQAPAQFDASGLTVTLREAVSDDGTRVPYHLVRPEGSGPVPTLIYGYGGFNVSLAPAYNPITGALWLERGGAYALAHIRGGGELGPDWHSAAKGAGRPRAFEDFAAIAADLAGAGLASPAQIGAHGASNGGLLTGVMLNRYPARFGAIWSAVGVYDMLGFHKFPAGRAWIDEYGDPDDPDAAAWLRAYSPLHTVPGAGTRLPPALITTSDHDDRVDPSHARRYAAALEAAGHTPWFYQHGGGHGGGGSSRAVAAEQALGHGFLAAHLGLR